MSKIGQVIFDNTFGVLLQAVPRKNGCQDCFFKEIPKFCNPCYLNDKDSEDIIYVRIPKAGQ